MCVRACEVCVRAVRCVRAACACLRVQTMMEQALAKYRSHKELDENEIARLTQQLLRGEDTRTAQLQQALRQLEAERLVTSQPHVGPVVTGFSEEAAAELFTLLEYLELRLLDRRHEEFARRNVKVVAVTLDTDEESLLTKDEFKHLTVVADHDRGLINAAGVLHAKANAKTGEDAAAPTTILIDRAGTVRWLFGSDNAFRRLSPDEVLAAIDRQMPAGK